MASACMIRSDAYTSAMAEVNSLHKALASDDPLERRDGLMQLAFILGDRVAQLEAVRRQLDLAVQQIDRGEGRKRPDKRKVLKSRHLRSTEEIRQGIEALISEPPRD